MLRYQLTHPTILAALASAGHGSRVLISDGHYPHTTGANPAAERVYLNLAPDRLLVTEVLAALTDAVPIESATVMTPPADQPEPPVFAEFRTALPHLPALTPLDRFAFYDTARGPDTTLVIATGDRRTYANLLLTLGVRQD
ncbi:RbsD or FucU transport [Streptomyces cocklensis]|jgi:L-fucose mutarotase|uniref:D-ribose pyranase n=1 Tax=Actinacidiphila cocklensis TaxID=887465 RepID=A0A9W4DWT3_9ACTN|nr:RbsD/FucU family protein [Actinacidiphila cocklensis]MDD1056857.1 RbsD or FucU transport [Actinacidiphila cocklensis]WSX78003.1 RbsD or FucU transport [Streptomyces sp. NBC_00899]CAG6397358.1 D-ribose pyranase [Actinacidiphila cocklensis]